VIAEAEVVGLKSSDVLTRWGVFKHSGTTGSKAAATATAPVRSERRPILVLQYP
jgi:hypothetical protein